ncbi:DUF1905 domain-containing protein [Fulvivirga sp. M361]|uniref:YdeI/OmpD-associated family protein n=1 Tax=Fulvivirga sp. M361 TaxID=2594266 RepID=UPI001179E597|nr:YdeI/OmpD-associated family protein [Fulvivirga sp. M361]TRX51997.1 DUF1905 domain-containing protein [Fulvivirga sp. M361]
MPTFQFIQQLKQLEKRKGGYFYLKIDSSIVDKYPKKRAVRLKCSIDQKITYPCGLNHFGDGNFFIIVASKYVKILDKKVGDKVSFEITEDPNPLGVEMPEALRVLLDQDEDARKTFDAMTDGKKRSLIYSIIKVKDIDKLVAKSLSFLNEQRMRQH